MNPLRTLSRNTLHPCLVTIFIVISASCASAPVAVPIQSIVSSGEPVQAATAEGPVLGAKEDALYVFRGIPYAAPVEGLNRWRPPSPPAKRDGIFDARTYGPACEQTVPVIPDWMLSDAAKISTLEMGGMDLHAAETKSADCLRMNIWTPTLNAPKVTPEVGSEPDPEAATVVIKDDENKDVVSENTSMMTRQESDTPAESERARESGLPVMVMLHGGGLAVASASSKAQAGSVLARKGVVVVGINYRLGPIGFLSADGLFEGDVLQGNRGMMDTVRALEWIRDNIANFGGDPNNVTLLGQSGGGTNAWAVLASPKSAGLVHRAIIMSGPINHVSIDSHKKLTEAVLSKWKVAPGDVDALASVSTEDATSTITSSILAGDGDYGELSRMYLPNTAAYGTEFLPDDVFTAIGKGRLNGIDLLVGSCDDDAKASTLAVPIPDDMAIDIWNGFIGGMIADTKKGEAEMAAKYVAAMPQVTPLRAKEQLQTDALYRLRALRAAELHSSQNAADAAGRTYAYQFNWKSPAAKGKLGALHGLDLIFAFGNLHNYPKALGMNNGEIPAKTQRLSDAMADAWVSFAKTGQPASSLLPTWPEYDGQTRRTMVFDVESQVVSDPGGELRALWQ